MPRCNFLLEDEQCNNTKGLTTITILDPENYIIEQSHLCQTHSNIIIGRYMKSYTDIQREIKFLLEERRDYRPTIYDQKSIKSVNEVVKDKYKIKNQISNKICRSLICDNAIYSNQQRYTATAYHSTGLMRHYFYFCSLKCINTFKASMGLMIPILQKQLTFTQF